MLLLPRPLVVLPKPPQQPRHPGTVRLQESRTEPWEPLEDAAPDHADHRQHHLHGMTASVPHHVALEDVSHLLQRRPLTFVETDRNVELFEGAPKRIVLGIVEP